MTDSVLLERDGAIATIVLNRPDKRNALTLEMWERLGALLAEVDADDSLRCLILRGAGEAAFAAGADIAEFPALRASAAQAKAYAERMEPALEGLKHCRHPSVAMILGACSGGGLELAALCDIRICGASARLGIPINRIGHALPYPGLEALVTLIGRAGAAELLLEGRVLTAAEALARGLVQRVLPDAEVEAEVQATAARIAAGAPLAARLHRACLNRLEDPAPLTAAETELPYSACDSADYREGIEAFMAKRPPRFQGR